MLIMKISSFESTLLSFSYEEDLTQIVFRVEGNSGGKIYPF